MVYEECCICLPPQMAIELTRKSYLSLNNLEIRVHLLVAQYFHVATVFPENFSSLGQNDSGVTNMGLYAFLLDNVHSIELFDIV